MIEFHTISLQIHRQRLLEQVSLKIQKGNKVVIRGSSGSGKSSLLKTAVGAIPISGGSISVEGQKLSAQTVADIRARIAFIGQEPVLGTETVREALLLPFTYKSHRYNIPSDGRILECLNRLHLQESILEKPCKHISGGEKQRIAIIRAQLLDKTIFLADEVTSALDPESRTAVMTELFRPEITLLSVSHDPEWIDRCNRKIDVSNRQLVEVDR